MDKNYENIFARLSHYAIQILDREAVFWLEPKETVRFWKFTKKQMWKDQYINFPLTLELYKLYNISRKILEQIDTN